jgi:hypothetical protein
MPSRARVTIWWRGGATDVVVGADDEAAAAGDGGGGPSPGSSGTDGAGVHARGVAWRRGT